MTEQACGASVYACTTRVAVLEQDGVPLPGAGHLYVTDALTKLTLTPTFYVPPEILVPNGCADISVQYMPLPRLKRYTLALEITEFDPELETMLVGGETFSSGGFTVGMSSPPINTAGVPYGVSLEVWSKHIVDGDVDGTWPFIHWVLPRVYLVPDPSTLDQNAMPRAFSGFTSQNPHWYNGPGNDWTYASDRSWFAAKTRTMPTPSCGAQTLASS